MPLFKSNPLGKIAFNPEDCDATLELSGLDESASIRRIERLLHAEPAMRGRRYVVHFDPPAGDGIETLFLPVGRFLLDARRGGRISRCLPLSDGSGYYFELP